MKKLSGAISEAVNINAGGGVSFANKVFLLIGLLCFSRVALFPFYVKCFLSRKYHWRKALLFERFATDMFIFLWKRYKPGFASVS